jgi:anthraniloyl-CoA monooxygenase
LTEAARIGFRGIDWPPQYLAGKSQLETNFERAAALAGTTSK